MNLHLTPQAVLGRPDDFATRSGCVIMLVVIWDGTVRGAPPNQGHVANARHSLVLAS